jgi:hypothetical protein
LPTPPCSGKLVIQKKLNKIALVAIGLETYDVLKKAVWISAYGVSFVFLRLPDFAACLL